MLWRCWLTWRIILLIISSLSSQHWQSCQFKNHSCPGICAWILKLECLSSIDCWHIQHVWQILFSWRYHSVLTFVVCVNQIAKLYEIYLKQLTTVVRALSRHKLIQFYPFTLPTNKAFTFYHIHPGVLDETFVLKLKWLMFLGLWLIKLPRPFVQLTHWGQNEIDTILQTTFSNAFSWMKMYWFCLTFHQGFSQGSN